MPDDTHQFLHKKVLIDVDRPLGTRHPRHGFIYPVNYGYIKGTVMPDGEALDAYVLGVFEPCERFEGVCIGYIQRLDEIDDKLIVVPEGVTYNDMQIRALTEFQERFFRSRIVRI